MHITVYGLVDVTLFSWFANARETAFAKRQLRGDPALENRRLDALSCGDAVQVQNQHGNRPLKWYATGSVVECLPNRQYKVLIDGSRRVTLRNRKFLRRISPICRRQRETPAPNYAEDPGTSPRQPATPHSHVPDPPAAHGEGIDSLMVDTGTKAQSPAVIDKDSQRAAPNTTPMRPRETIHQTSRRILPFGEEDERCPTGREASEPNGTGTSNTDGEPRRSRRNRAPPIPFSPKLYGQSHF